MSTTLTPIITDAGLQAVFAASNTGLQAEITHIAVGDRGYAPDKEATKLQSERVRIPVADATRVGETQIHLTGILDGDVQFWVREIGFILSDGTLLALWSNAEAPLAYKSEGVDLFLAFDLTLSALPAQSVTVLGPVQTLSAELEQAAANLDASMEALSAITAATLVGPWLATESYVVGQCVYASDGQTYRALAESLNVNPVTDKQNAWTRITVSLGETSETAFRGDLGKIAYEHAQKPHAESNLSDYVIDVTDADGAVDIVLADIGHPIMPKVFNPVVNVLSATPYFFCISKRSTAAFTVQLYTPDGQAGAAVSTSVPCGTFACGAGTVCGDPGMAVVRLAVSIPNPAN